MIRSDTVAEQNIPFRSYDRETIMSDTNLHPYRVQVPQAELDDVRDRLARTRWTDEIEGSGSDYGVPVAQVRAWAQHWLTRFDWRALEHRLNGYPQFTTEIDGQDIHFLHVRSGRPDAV